jgi:hypothetical protein
MFSFNAHHHRALYGSITVADTQSEDKRCHLSTLLSILISHLLESEDPCCTNSKKTSMGNEVAPILSHTILMQEPTEDAEEVEPTIPTEIVSNGPSRPNLNATPTVAARRKAAKRTLPWDLKAGELDLVSPTPQPQAELIPARKKPRLEEPFSASTDEAARKTASTDVSEGLPPPAAIIDDVNADPVTDAQPNAVATRATGSWTPEEDAQLTVAVANASKKKYGKEHKTDWVAISASVPGRTRTQCNRRWQDVLDPSIDRVSGRAGKWAEDEDNVLKDAVQIHGGKNWAAITTLVPGRTRNQCTNRWRDALNPSIALTAGRTGKWAEDEDIKLKFLVKGPLKTTGCRKFRHPKSRVRFWSVHVRASVNG